MAVPSMPVNSFPPGWFIKCFPKRRAFLFKKNEKKFALTAFNSAFFINGSRDVTRRAAVRNREVGSDLYASGSRAHWCRTV